MKTRRAYKILSQGLHNPQNQIISSPNNQPQPEIKKKNMGHWNPEQQALYYIFLQNYRENFVKKELRRTDKIFKEMSKFVKTRCPDQCRSHHQKMENKFPQFDHILDSLKLNCPQSIVQDILRQFQQESKCTTSSCETNTQDVPEENSLKTQEGPSNVEQVALLSFQDIVQIQQAIKPTLLLADELFNIEGLAPF